MKFESLKTSLTNGVMPIYLIEGEDAFLRESALKLLKDGFLQEPDFNLSNLTAEDIKQDPEALYTAVQSYPFMGDKRFVVVRDYYPTANDLKSKMIKAVFNEPIDTTVLIIVNSEPCLPLKKLETVTLVDCAKLSEDLISRWLRAEAKKSDVIIDKDAITLLIEYSNGDMTKISGELNKLIGYVGNGGQIGENDVEMVCTKDTDYNVFALTDAVSKGQTEKVLSMIKDMMSKSSNKYQLFASLYYHYRKLLHVSISSLSDSELAESLNIKNPKAIFVLKNQAKNFKVKRLKEICDKFSVYDASFKRGDVTEDNAFWNAIFNSLIK